MIHLSYSGSGGLGGNGPGSVYNAGPKPVSSVAWHVERGTRVITASEDDGSPVILVWDLRNYRTPERILTGHEKGILSLDWCKSDPDLLFSCGKDCRTLAWNPSTGEMVGELPATTNWSFDVASCPRNPSYVATASFDGKITVSSLQSTGSASSESAAPAASAAAAGSSNNAADIFSAGNLSSLAAQVHPGVSLKQAPRWLKRPASTSFGFGGKLATLSTAKAATAVASPAAQQAGAPAAGAEKPAPAQSVKIHQVVTEAEVVERALKLDEAAADNAALAEFCEQKQKQALRAGDSNVGESAEQLSSWKLLGSLFRANSREELVTMLGFSKADLAAHVHEAISKIRASDGSSGSAADQAVDDENDNDGASSVAREPLVASADQQQQDALSGSSEGEAAATKATDGQTSRSSIADSASAVSEATTKLGAGASTEGGGADTEITEPSLFSDNDNNGQADGADFFSGLGQQQQGAGQRPVGLSDRFALSQANLEDREGAGSSVAATNGGSRASSAAGGGGGGLATGKASPAAGDLDNSIASSGGSPFQIYPSSSTSAGSSSSEEDRLLTRALVLGDFDSAVELCLSRKAWADALLFAVRGGPALLSRVQRAYFAHEQTSRPYLRVLRSVVDADLGDIVRNADLAGNDWKEVFVVLCTFSSHNNNAEFADLVAQLGERLHRQDRRKEAMTCYVAAGRLEKIVGIWDQEMLEDEEAELGSQGDGALEGASASARYVQTACLY